jgi:hypothetical protein
MQNLQKFLALEEKEIQTKEDEDRQPQSTLSLGLAIIKTPKRKSSWRQWRRYEGNLPKTPTLLWPSEIVRIGGIELF